MNFTMDRSNLQTEIEVGMQEHIEGIRVVSLYEQMMYEKIMADKASLK